MSNPVTRSIGRMGIALAKRFSLSDWDRALDETFRGYQTSAGVAVSPSGAVKQPEIRAAISNLSSDMARMPLPLMRKQNGKREEQRQHPLWRVLNQKPNPQQTAYELRRHIWAQYLTYGNSATLIDRDKFNRVSALYPLDWLNITVEGEIGPGKSRIFRHHHSSGPRVYQESDIFLLTDFAPRLDECGLGEARTAAVADSIGLSLAIERYASLFFANGGKPGILLENPAGFESKEAAQAAVEAWNKQHSGPRAHGVGFLSKGMKLAGLMETKNNEAQMLEARRYQKEQGAMTFRMPLHLLQDLQRGTFSNIAKQGVEYVVYTLLNMLTQFEQAGAVQLLDASDMDRGLYLKHNVKSLLRGDPQAQAEFYRLMIQWGLMTQNEIRELEDLDPVDGGEIFLRPANMIAVGLDGKPVEGQNIPDPAQAPSQDGELSDRDRGFVSDEVRRQLEEILGGLPRVA